MSDPSLTQPNATTFLIEELVALVREGRVRVPEFQRPLRWQWEDVRRLFDSILRGYPIGSMLFWARQAPAATVRLGALSVNAPALMDALWVIDGQQRITSLANALSDAGSADPRFALAYDLRARKLDRPSVDEPYRLPLPVLFDLQRLLKWFASRPDAAEYLDEATRVAKAIRQYTAPAYIVKQEDEAVLRDIFDRMNNYGRRLSRAEVFTALHSAQESSGPPRTLTDIAEHLDARFGFGLLDEDTVLRAFLARRGADVTREIRVEFDRTRVAREFPDETPEDANRGAEAALERVLSFLQEDAHVPHLAFLPYRYLLVVLARFFAHHPDPAQRNRDLLRRWFWRAAIVGPSVARGAYTSAMRTLASCIVPDDETRSVESLLTAISNAAPAPSDPTRLPFTFPKRFKTTMAEVRFLLCALWALAPRSASSGEPYERALLSSTLSGRNTASEALELCFPRKKAARSEPGNRILLLGDDANETPRELFSQRPLLLPEATWNQVLASHALDRDLQEHLRHGDADAFVLQRGLLMEQVTLSFLERMTEASFEDTPPLDDLDLDDDVIAADLEERGSDAHA